jgi:hypothetical protein
MLSRSLTAIVLATLLGVSSAEAGAILDLDFSSGTVLQAAGAEIQEYVEHGVTVIAIPRIIVDFPSSVSFHLFADYFDFGVTSGTFLNVNAQDNGAAEFSLDGRPFDLLSADISTLSLPGILEGFVDDSLRVSAVFPCCTYQFNTFTFEDDPAWRGITALVFTVSQSGGSIGFAIDNLRLHVPLPPSWMLFGSVAVLVVTACQLGFGQGTAWRRRPRKLDRADRKPRRPDVRAEGAEGHRSPLTVD